MSPPEGLRARAPSVIDPDATAWRGRAAPVGIADPPPVVSPSRWCGPATTQKLIGASPRRREAAPQALSGHPRAEPCRPLRLAAALVAPGPQRAREAVQRVLVAVAQRAE